MSKPIDRAGRGSMRPCSRALECRELLSTFSLISMAAHSPRVDTRRSLYGFRDKTSRCQRAGVTRVCHVGDRRDFGEDGDALRRPGDDAPVRPGHGRDRMMLASLNTGRSSSSCVEAKSGMGPVGIDVSLAGDINGNNQVGARISR